VRVDVGGLDADVARAAAYEEGHYPVTNVSMCRTGPTYELLCLRCNRTILISRDGGRVHVSPARCKG